MKILFIIRSTANFYYTESVLDALLRRGHNVQVLCEKTKEHWIKGEYTKPIEEFKKKYPDFTFGQSFPRTDAWRPFIMPVRVLLNYRRYLFAENQSKYFRERNIKYLPGIAMAFLKIPGVNYFIKTKFFSNLLYKLEDLAGVDRKILSQVKDYSPDLVFVTLGGMRYGAMDSDYIKAAKVLRIKSAVMALSWDSVSNKALLHIKPDVFLVWNEIHAQQARDHHGAEESIIKIIGAPFFDGWFPSFKPLLTREEFCIKYGMDAKLPILLYLGSTSTIAEDESWLVRETREALNNSRDANLKNIQMVFRPHPSNSKVYTNMNIKGVIVLPRATELIDTHDSRQLFCDTLSHAFAITAINNSGMIDAIILNKPILALMRKQYVQTQQDAEHFKAMMMVKPFFITNIDKEMLDVLKNLLAGKDDKKSARAEFIKRFIRPNGANISAGECAAVELEKLM